MSRTLRRWLDVVPYLGLAVAIMLGSWSFMRSEHYREETDILLMQSYEVQWRGSQIRERLANIVGLLRLSMATGDREAQLAQEIGLLQFNMVALRNLQYIDHFLDPQDFARLDRSIQTIRTRILPNISAAANDQESLALLTDIQQDMFQVSGTTGAHSRTLNETAHIAENALRNVAIFVLALSAVIVVGVFIHQQSMMARRKDQQIRSFSSLFAHMTRSRVVALALFIKSLRDGEAPDPEMVAAASRAAAELDSINNGLVKIAYSAKPTRTVALQSILDALSQDHGGRIQFDVPEEARAALVASPQFHLILDELIRNAEQAVAAAGKPDSPVVLRARLTRRFPLGRRLVLEVIDNGLGMSRAVRAKAAEPFFSMRAGSHVGLGLTGCAEMVKALGGRFRIESAEGRGTSVRILYPLRRETGTTGPASA
ncbi:sensor histidine kinase [Mycobacterium sp. KBS0706]|uniref:sensor histidine kinase n=1 Tax=Mycobacterium sp. KBS0706 TaxID=2578109 RepID=UPI00110FA1AB|nr:sensor histidine kinase [Mycobacterium sp. KBS0706]TSD86911.1 sensor histidine kinase [Mycobacterium sp. KBS0706]